MTPHSHPARSWDLSALFDNNEPNDWALIVLNLPFPKELFKQVWDSTAWHCFADGAANRVFDTLQDNRRRFLPNLIKGDLDSIRSDVRQWYENQGVDVVQDHDQNSTDLMKCMSAIESLERSKRAAKHLSPGKQLGVVLLGGLAGRVDHTIHTISYLHKLRKTRDRVFVVTEENVSWILDAGEHLVHLDRSFVGPTCGLLPIGVDHTILSTRGLRWNLTDARSSFDGLMSTSNALAADEVWIKTSRPIFWCVERKAS